MMTTYIEFFEVCFQKSRRWKLWQGIWAGINVVALLMGSLPDNIRKYWYVYVIGLL